MISRLTWVCLVCLCVFSAVMRGQDVEGVSEIQYDKSTNQVMTYSATELDYTASLYYDAYVEGYLYESTQTGAIQAGSATGNPTAAGSLQATADQGASFELQSDHYVIAFYVVGYDGGGDPIYDDPSGYGFTDGGYDGGGEAGYGGGSAEEIAYDYIYLGSTIVDTATYDQQPIIDSISPSTFGDNTTTQVTIQGQNFGTSPNLIIGGLQTSGNLPGSTTYAGISYAIESSTNNTIVANFTTAAASDGQYGVQVASNGASGNGFTSGSGGTGGPNTSNTATVSVGNGGCPISIAGDGSVFSIGSDYRTATIPLTAQYQNSLLTCPNAQVTWQLEFYYSPTRFRGPYTQSVSANGSSFPGTTLNYVTSPGMGGEVHVTALLSWSNQTGCVHPAVASPGFTPPPIGGNPPACPSQARGGSEKASATFYLAGTSVPAGVLKAEANSLYTGNTPDLLSRIACMESSTLQFSAETLFGIQALWPRESTSDGGSHIGFLMEPVNMPHGFDYISNATDASSLLAYDLGAATRNMTKAQSSAPSLPALTHLQLEQNAVTYYGPYGGLQGYWVPNAGGTSWVQNTMNPKGLNYVNGVFACTQ